ncbi:MAG TPA: glycosyltransferase family 9 protein [Stellaceae bacterium]|jgi:lipopolysaccharide export system permease protein|nr:glycosyltransferase family 9 protein [Stellaceae bacterium]
MLSTPVIASALASRAVPPLGARPRILFVTATRIGDAVLSTGLLRHLVDRFPDARFTIVAGPLAAPLFTAVPGLEKLIALTKRKHARHWLDLYRQVVGTSWDLVVDLRGSALAWLLRARYRRVGAKGTRRMHRVEVVGQTFGLVPPPAPIIYTAENHRRTAAMLLGPDDGRPLLAIAPVASWGGKQWRGERFAELIRRLTRDGPLQDARVAVVAAASEREKAAPVLSSIPPDRLVDAIGAGDLPTVAALLGQARLFIGNDSGLMHMAAAMQVPTLGLFGPSPVTYYAPWGPHTDVAATTISYEALTNSPEFDHRLENTHMDTLSVDSAEETARALLARTASPAGVVP